MREIRTSGSVRGEGGDVLTYSARNFDDGSRLVELLEAGVGVSQESALVELQVLARVLPLAIGRVSEPDSGRDRVARWPVVANISPESSCLGPAVAWSEYRYRRVVGMELACRHNMIADGCDQRRKQLTGCSNPSGQRGAVKVDAFASIDL